MIIKLTFEEVGGRFNIHTRGLTFENVYPANASGNPGEDGLV